MNRVTLGRTGIEVSKLGIGTGTAHPSGHCAQALMEREKLAELLVFAFDHGINFWDTAVQYGTYPHIREALKHVKRSDVVITTKLLSTQKKDTIRDFNDSLRALNVDYIDVCLLHGIKTERELKTKLNALDTLLELKREGKVRAVGLSSHGISALQAVTKLPEIELVWVRLNFAGICMDSCSLNIYDQRASISWIKKTAQHLLPERIRTAVRPKPESQLISTDDRQAVEDTVRVIHSQSKGVVGMKVLAEGQLKDDAQRSIRYVRDLPYVDSFIIGMLNKDEIVENCKTADVNSEL
ncbi:MAG: aldo/keto reductase [Thermodesulfovibrionia bacterium]|nr:aldo/keto reductase [Thermodesulfovibrionia bacterium]